MYQSNYSKECEKKWQWPNLRYIYICLEAGRYQPKNHWRHPSPDKCRQSNMKPDCQLLDRDVLHYSKVAENRPMSLNSGNYKERSGRGLISVYIMQPRCINLRITTKNLIQDCRSPGRYITKNWNYNSLCTYSYHCTHLLDTMHPRLKMVWPCSNAQRR